MSREPPPGPSSGTCELKFISRKGGTILLHAGHQFTKKNTCKTGAAVWECHLRKSTKCPGTIKIQGSNILWEKPHTCTPDLNKNLLDCYIEDCKKKIASTSVPAIPTTFNETISEMKDFGLDKVIPKSRIIVFCSEEARLKMGCLKDYFGDGTFKSCPKLFNQIFTIHADLISGINSTAITPLVYALMTDRTKESYEMLFSLIKSKIPDWNPTSFTCDFEEATMSAIMKVFPSVDLHGCYYHFNKAVWRKGRDLKLTKSRLLRRQVALSAVLPLLPVDKIMEGWFYIAAESPDDSQSEQFRKNMLSQWLRPNFIKVWCSFGKRHRTNNFAEGWHYKLNSAVGKKSPSILKLLITLNQDANLFSIKAEQIQKQRTQQSIENDEFIMECQMKLISGEIAVGHFLEKVRK